MAGRAFPMPSAHIGSMLCGMESQKNHFLFVPACCFRYICGSQECAGLDLQMMFPACLCVKNR